MNSEPPRYWSIARGPTRSRDGLDLSARRVRRPRGPERRAAVAGSFEPHGRDVSPALNAGGYGARGQLDAPGGPPGQLSVGPRRGDRAPYTRAHTGFAPARRVASTLTRGGRPELGLRAPDGVSLTVVRRQSESSIAALHARPPRMSLRAHVTGKRQTEPGPTLTIGRASLWGRLAGAGVRASRSGRPVVAGVRTSPLGAADAGGPGRRPGASPASARPPGRPAGGSHARA